MHGLWAPGAGISSSGNRYLLSFPVACEAWWGSLSAWPRCPDGCVCMWCGLCVVPACLRVCVCPCACTGVSYICAVCTHPHTNTGHDNPSQAVSTQLSTDMSILVLMDPGSWSFQATWKPCSPWTPPGALPACPPEQRRRGGRMWGRRTRPAGPGRPEPQRQLTCRQETPVLPSDYRAGVALQTREPHPSVTRSLVICAGP